eukprot:TRINITY_DN19935_c0_g1_i1.p1 TRINITY_DN19935_c0_g1~~TRINITY_DN19935_c0_g1_i1.p1  ORF type:complete len:564 (+),score=119.23 TRINITY_DN19935_c0_g1_i1:102-1793(+)
MEGSTQATKYQAGSVEDPFFELLNPNPAAGKTTGRIEDLDQSGDNILPSYEFHNTRPSLTPGGKFQTQSSVSDSKPGVSLSGADNSTWKPANSAGQAQPSGASASQPAPQDTQDRLMMAAVDKVMKKYADNMLLMLDGINGRLGNVEQSVHQMQSQVEQLQKTSADNHGEIDGHSRMLENMLREVQRSLQVLRDKQELAEAQAELSKLAKAASVGAGNEEPSLPASAPAQAASIPQPANVAPSAPLVPQPGSEMSSAPPYARGQLMQLPAPPQQSHQAMLSSTTGAPFEQSHLQPQLQPPVPPPQPQASQQQPQHYHQVPAQHQGPQQPGLMPTQSPGLQYGQQPYHQLQQQPSPGMPPNPTQGPAPPMPMPQPYGQQPGVEPSYMGNNYGSQPQQPPHPQYGGPQQQLQEPPRMSNPVPHGGYGMNVPPQYGQEAPYAPPQGLPRSQMLQPSASAQPATGPGGYPRLQTALPVSNPSGPPAASSSTAPLSTSRVPIDKVIDDVAAMGFSKAEVGAVVKKLTENGQSVDLNVVLDKLMNGGGSRGGPQGGELAGKPTGWFGGR